MEKKNSCPLLYNAKIFDTSPCPLMRSQLELHHWIRNKKNANFSFPIIICEPNYASLLKNEWLDEENFVSPNVQLVFIFHLSEYIIMIRKGERVRQTWKIVDEDTFASFYGSVVSSELVDGHVSTGQWGTIVNWIKNLYGCQKKKSQLT